jgi:putative membrane-bound dehydrogenase-like protein
LLGLLLLPTSIAAAPPVATDPRLIVELVAAEPDLVTPTGVAVDEDGRIWVIENHTHQRPANYKGPTHDRIRVFEDFGPDGKARKVTTWADGFKDSMGIALGKDGAVFLATRSTIYLLRDTKGKGQADEKKVLARLDTKADYPHNGLSGFAIDALGELHFGLGENFGAPYKLIGSDNTTLTGGGEGGSIYRMKPDGTGLVRLATGFWNPFHMAFDRWGRLFAVDNDPDARGPCRLLHIVPGGDYGYRFKYGRKGIHPFQSWNGELPGTLPMVAGTAEAPSGIVAYESDGLPEEYRGLLLVTSWGDHVIEQFALEPRGASFGAKKKVLVRGGEDFRPVGIALAPDGSVVVSDWVDKSYPVHGKGRLWRIRMKDPLKRENHSLAAMPKLETAALKSLLGHARRDVRLAAAEALLRRSDKSGDLLLATLKNHPDPLARLHSLWGLAQCTVETRKEAIAIALDDFKSPLVRAAAASMVSRLLPAKDLEHFEDYLGSLSIGNKPAELRLAAMLALDRARNFTLTMPGPNAAVSDDPFVVHGLVTIFAGRGKGDLPSLLKAKSWRIVALLTMRRLGETKYLPEFLADDDPSIRRAAIQWVAEENLTQYAKLIDAAATKAPVSREVFEAWVAAKELLANPGPLKNPSDERSGDVFVLKVVKEAQQPAALRALALHMLRPDHPQLKLADLTPLLTAEDKALRAEAIRALIWRSDAESQKLLRAIVADEKEDSATRRDAIQGLALSAASSADTRKLLVELLEGRQFETDVLRSLRGVVPPEDPIAAKWWKSARMRAYTINDDPVDLAEHGELAFTTKKAEERTTPRLKTVEEWSKFLTADKRKGDPAAGERVFFHAKGPRCYACHRIDGRGEAVGPDLSHIGTGMNRAKLIESILEPSKEIAPAFVTWLVTTRDGKQHTGVIVAEGFDSTLTLADANGKRIVLKITEIEDRVMQKTSLMPADLHSQMTRQEFVDLLAFLESRK